MSKEDHPSFQYKDYSNSPHHFLDEAQRLLADTLNERQQTLVDLKFIEIMLKEWGRD